MYRFDATGALIQTIQPPDAIVPLDSGDPDFTSDDDPDTGRAGNQGMTRASSERRVAVLISTGGRVRVLDRG